MKLNPDPKTIVSKHSKVSAKRASELVEFLSNVHPDILPEVVATFRGNQMPAAEMSLVEDLLGLSKPVESPLPLISKKTNTEKTEK